jgi:tetratricopeptide (TPR) repeat protein
MGRSRRSNRLPRRILKTKRFLIALAVLLLLSGSVYGIHSVQAKRQASSLLEVARAARDEKDWVKAADFYKQYANYRKRDVEGLSEWAGVLEEISFTNPRRWNTAATAYENVLNIDPDRHADRRKVALLYLRVGRYGPARKHLETLLRSGGPAFQDEPETYELLARCDRAERNTEALKANLQKAIATGKAKPAIYLELAGLLRSGTNGDPAALEADHVMNEMIAARPKDLAARLARARYRVRYGDRAGAIEDIRVAYTEIPGGNADIDVILQHAELLAETDREAARLVILQGLKIHPDHPLLTLGLAEVLNRSGSTVEGAKLLREAATRLPDGDLQLVTIGDRLIDVNDLESASAIAVRLEANPAGINFGKYLAGRVATRLGSWPTAIPLLQAAVPSLGNRPDLLFKARLALGNCYAAANDPDRQEEHFWAASALDPKSQAAKLGRADALVKLGREKEAVEIYRELTRLVPAARVALALLKLNELAALPEDNRNWAEFDALLGPLDQLDPLLEVAYAQSLLLQNKPAAAEAVLVEGIARDPKRLQSWIALAHLFSVTDLDAAWMILEEAQRKLGDRADLRLAKAQLLINVAQSPDIAALLRLADGAEGLTPVERYTLWKGLGSVLASLGKNANAAELLKKAASEQPFDLDVRFALFDLASRAKMSALAEKMFEEIRKLDGDTGAVATAAAFGRDISQSGWLTAEQLAQWRPRIDAALQKRNGWGRLHTIAGDIASLDKRTGDALGHYLKAIDRRDFSEPILRRVVEILMERQRYREVATTLGRADIQAVISPVLRRQYELARAATGLDSRAVSLAIAREKTLEESHNYREQLARAGVFTRYGLHEEALEALQKAKALNDGSPPVRIAIVRLLVGTGRKELAIAETKDAEKRLRDPRLKFDNPAEVPSALGECKELTGDTAGAIAEYTTAAQVKPADPLGWQQLYDLLRRAKYKDDAERLLVQLTGSEHPEVVQWSRRQQAKALSENLIGAAKGLPASLKKLR